MSIDRRPGKVTVVGSQRPAARRVQAGPGSQPGAEAAGDGSASEVPGRKPGEADMATATSGGGIGWLGAALFLLACVIGGAGVVVLAPLAR